MKRFVMLFAVLVAVGCSDSGNEPNVYNPLDLGGDFVFRFKDTATGQYDQNFKTVYIHVDSTKFIIDKHPDGSATDSNIIENFGFYNGKSVNKDFTGICILDSVKINISMKLVNNRLEGYFKREYPTGIVRTKYFYAGSNL